MPNFSPTQQRVLRVLSDGAAHSKEELKNYLWDELSDISAVKVMIFNLRKVLREVGEDIAVIQKDGTCYYCHVRKVQVE